MKKKLTSVLLAIALLLTFIPISAVSVSAANSGGDYAYTVSDGKTTITDYTGSGGVITIPSTLGGYPVTSIGKSAFSGCDSLTSVTIGDSVTSIGDYAFYHCDSLTSVTIGDSVTSISDYAFYGCHNLTSVTIGDSVTSIGYGAFHYCDSLTSVTIPDSVTSIGISAFRDCSSLTSVTIPDSVTSIGGSAFSSCYSLTSVYITDVAAWCGINFSSTTSNPFYYAHNLYLNGELVTELTIPDSVTRIGYGAFFDCDSLTSVTIPDSVTSIGKYAFYNCDSLTSVTIGDSVTSIGDYAFYSCGSLTSVTIPDSVTSIGDYAFYKCYQLTDVWYTGSETDRNAITIGFGNSCLNDAVWHYNTCADEHSFTNDCDTTCNECGYIRTITHDYTDATCTEPKTCSVCGATDGAALGHDYDHACDKSCNVCGATRTVGAHTYKKVITKATTTKDGKIKNVCTKCGYTSSKVTTIYKASKVSLSTTSYTYTGSVKKPSVVVKDSKGKTISSKYYTVTYASGRKNVGTYKVTVKFKGNYSGTKTLTFKINPAKTTVKSLTAGKKSLKVAITKKSTQVTGYQIQYSTSKSFKSYKTKWLTSYKKTSATLSGLSAKKTYYVRVRTYKKVGGVTYYSGWSTIKYKKTK